MQTDLPDDPPYPLIECDDHPGVREPGYLICVHIKKPEDIEHFAKATSASLGMICCKYCYGLRKDTEYLARHTRIGCAVGLREAGYLIGIQ